MTFLRRTLLTCVAAFAAITFLILIMTNLKTAEKEHIIQNSGDDLNTNKVRVMLTRIEKLIKNLEVRGLCANNKDYDKICTLDKGNLAGRLYVNKTVPNSDKEIEQYISFVEYGGKWKPKNCTPEKHIAIIIPYRDRIDNLRLLLRHLNPILRRQLISYQVFIIEQGDHFPFNKGKLLNIAYSLIKKNYTYDCLVFHDADFLSADDRNLYNCPASPRHMSPIVEKFKYIKHSDSYFGGVIAVYPKDFEDINGWSNSYWGWGGEDDDFYLRFQLAKKVLSRSSVQIGRFDLAYHNESKQRNDRRYTLIMRAKERGSNRQTSGLDYLHYKLISITEERFFIRIKVDVQMTKEEHALTSVKIK